MATTEAEVATGPEVGVEPEFPPHLMSIDRYKRLVESGVFGPDEPVFLWKGRLVEKRTKGDSHAFSSSSVVAVMIRLVPDGWAVRADQPIVLGDDSVPEPDLTIIRGSLGDYAERTPKARDVALVVEVSDSSLRVDSRGVLKALASDGIPVYWIVNIPECQVEVYTNPTGPSKMPTDRDTRIFGPDDEVPVILDGREVGRIVAREILP